jgi:capsular polysaccharide biosynthesis protein
VTLPSGRPTSGTERHRSITPAVTDWVGQPPESEGLPYYLATLRANVWVIIVATAICVAVAVALIAVSPKVYEAEADLLVTPVSGDNPSLVGLGLPTNTSDPTRDVETIARLIETRDVATRVVRELRLRKTPSALLADVRATPVAASNVIAVTARSDSPGSAARIATAFADASVADRTSRLHDQLDVLIPRLRQELAQLGSTEQIARDALAQRIRDLQTLRALDDPTIRRETAAVPNSSPVSPRPVLSLAAAILAGLLVGCGVVLVAQLLDPRLRREQQLRRYRLPILARVPLEHGGLRRSSLPLLPGAVSPATHDAYHLLAASLAASTRSSSAKRSVLITGPTPGDGKSTSALHLATAVATNRDVALIEADSRRPSLAKALGATPRAGLANVVAGRVPFGNALVGSADGVRLLVQIPTEPPLAAVLTPASAERLVDEAHLVVDWVIFDSPPLALVPDALPLVTSVDDVVLVVRLGHTRLKSLEELVDLLVQHGVTPAGFVLIGARAQSSYYGS